MSQKKKKPNPKTGDKPTTQPIEPKSNPNPSNKFNSFKDILEPAQFEKTALIILNLFFGVQFITGFLLFFFATNGF